MDKRKKKQAIFFDLDGVLVLTEPIHLLAWQQVLKQLKCPQNFFRLEEVYGHTDMSMAQNLIKSFHLNFSVKELCLKKKNFYLSLLKKSMPSSPGRNEFLDRTYQNYLLAIVSSSTREEIDMILHHEKLTKYFSFSLAYEDTQNHKPDPAPYLLALQKAKITPKQVLVIEDSPPGIASAQSAHIPVIALNTTQTQLYAENLVGVCRDFNEVGALIF